MNKIVLTALLVMMTCGGADAQQVWPKPTKPLSDGPFAHEFVTDTFEMSRDFAFDGQGNIIGRNGVGIVRVDGEWVHAGKRAMNSREGVKNVLAPPNEAFFWILDGPHGVHGQRFRANGDLVFANPVAKPQKKKMGIIARHPGAVRGDPARGNIRPFLMPKYVHTDLAGNVWYAGGRSRSTAQGAPEPTINLIGPPPNNAYTNIISGAPLQKPRGIVYDSVRRMIFYTEEETHTVMALSYAPGGKAEKVQEVARLPEGPARNVTLDEYGNLYACSGDHVYRLRLDAKGAIQAKPVALNKEPLPRASSAQFGHGPTWDRHSLYVMCEPENWKFKLGTVANFREFISYIYKLELGVAGDPDSQMDPSKFDQKAQKNYELLIAERLKAYPEYLVGVEENVRERVWVRENPIKETKPYLTLAKLGATIGVGYNHDPMLMLNGKNLTGNEDELASLPELYAAFEKRRATRASSFNQFSSPGWTFTISVADNPEMVNFECLQDISPMDIALDGCTQFSDSDLMKLNKKRGLKRITLRRTGVTISGVADFLQKTRIDYLRVNGVNDANIETLIEGLRKAGTRDLGIEGKGLTLAGVRKLATLPKLAVLTVGELRLSRDDIAALRQLMPRVAIRNARAKVASSGKKK